MPGFKQWRRRARRLWTSVAVAAALPLLLACVVMWFEDRLIYYPTRDLVDTPSDYGLDYEDVWQTTTDGVRVHGWAMLPAGAPRAWILFSHGNAGNISRRPAIARPLVMRGYGVLLYDYRGYGKSVGAPNELGTYLDGEAMLAETVRRAGDPALVFLFGRSLGGAVSYELALRHPELGGLITDCSFTSVPDMARTLIPIPGLSILVRTRYDNLSKASRIRLPRLILHGTRDELVPFSMAEKLRDATRPPAAFVAIDGAGHNDTFARGGSEYYEAIRRFIDQHRGL